MEKRILDDVPVKNLCPKCGCEMELWFLGNPNAHACMVCGHESKVGDKHVD
jgi:Zn ribbon nucleic-acid-binding protein